MTIKMETIFCTPELEEQIDAFLAQDQDFVQAEEAFYESAREIAQLAGFERYDRFECRLGVYLNRLTNLHYLFGLGLRQEVLRALRPYSSSRSSFGSGGITGRSPSSWSK